MTTVVDGATRWSWSPSAGALTNEGSENAETGLGPGTALVDPALILPAIEFELRGRTTMHDRLAYEVLATPFQDDEEGESLGLLHGIGSGAEEYALLVDAERGVLLRSEARLHGRPFLVLELDEVAFDEELPADTFTPAAASGEEFETVPRCRSLRLEDLPRAVDFTVLVPERAPEDADVQVMIEPALPRHGVPEHASITYHTFDPDAPPIFLALRESAAPMSLPEKPEWRDADGMMVVEDRHTDPPTILVRLEANGTHVELSSRAQSEEQLLGMGLWFLSRLRIGSDDSRESENRLQTARYPFRNRKAMVRVRLAAEVGLLLAVFDQIVPATTACRERTTSQTCSRHRAPRRRLGRG